MLQEAAGGGAQDPAAAMLAAVGGGGGPGGEGGAAGGQAPGTVVVQLSEQETVCDFDGFSVQSSIICETDTSLPCFGRTDVLGHSPRSGRLSDPLGGWRLRGEMTVYTGV